MDSALSRFLSSSEPKRTYEQALQEMGALISNQESLKQSKLQTREHTLEHMHECLKQLGIDVCIVSLIRVEAFPVAT